MPLFDRELSARGNYARLIIRRYRRLGLTSALFDLVTIHEARYRSPGVAAANRAIAFTETPATLHARGLCSPLLSRDLSVRAVRTAILSSDNKSAPVSRYGVRPPRRGSPLAKIARDIHRCAAFSRETTRVE